MVNRSVSSQSGGGISDSKSTNYQAIPLLRPEEVMKLPSHIALIVRSGSSPIKAKQYIWYKEVAMKHLVQAPSFIPQQVITQQPFERLEKPVVMPRATPKKKAKETQEDSEVIFDWAE